jgi:hypothetical protein
MRRENAMFEALENNPTLRERVLGLTAIGAILIGGAAGVDTMLTSGWQIGGTGGAPVMYADSTPQYQDDVTRNWTTTPPQRVQLASQDAVPTFEAASFSAGLDGSNDGTVTPASSAPTPSQQSTQPEPASDAQRQQSADQRFDVIENDIRQATAALEPDAATKDASESASPS